MNLAMASLDFKYDQARTRSIELSQFFVRGGKLLYKSIGHITNAILIAAVFFLSFLALSSMEDPFYYIVPFGLS